MNDVTNNLESPGPEFEGLESRLAELGAQERACAPGSLEGRIFLASAGVLNGVGRKPKGVLARLNVRRLDWPMRVAAVIAVAIGGWAVLHGVRQTERPARATYDGEALAKLLGAWPSSGAADQLRELISTAGSIEDSLWNTDLIESDTESL